MAGRYRSSGRIQHHKIRLLAGGQGSHHNCTERGHHKGRPLLRRVIAEDMVGRVGSSPLPALKRGNKWLTKRNLRP